MKVKDLMVILTMLLFVSSITIGLALAGDGNNPEVDDLTGDGDSDFRDIDAAWFGDEDNATITISMKLAGSPPPLPDYIQDFDTTVYDHEVYFDVSGTGYAVSTSVQYAFTAGGGVFTLTTPWEWELREVNYASNTNIIHSESAISGIEDTNRSYNNAILTWTLDKSDIGIEYGFSGRGQALVRTWAAIWNADDLPPDEQRDPLAGSEAGVSDYANTHTAPGFDYHIRGAGDVDYNVILTVDETEKETYGGTTVEFLVQAYNNGTNDFTVDLFSVYSDLTWSVVLNPNSTTIPRGNTKIIEVKVTPPKDVPNGTVLTVVIGGNIHEVDGSGFLPILEPLTLTVVGLYSPGGGDEGGWLDTLMDNLAIIAGVIAVVVVATIVLAVLIRR